MTGLFTVLAGAPHSCNGNVMLQVERPTAPASARWLYHLLVAAPIGAGRQCSTRQASYLEVCCHAHMSDAHACAGGLQVELLNETSFDRRRQVAVYKNDGKRGHHMQVRIPARHLGTATGWHCKRMIYWYLAS